MQHSEAKDGDQALWESGIRLLHISADYPDPIRPAKTPAISNLLELAVDHDHRVLSLNRTGWGSGIHALRFSDTVGDQNAAITYSALPHGLGHLSFLRRLAEWTIASEAQSAFRPDAIHAHKLSIEGLVAAQLADHLGLPFFLSIQGNTDLKILRARPDLRATYRRVWQQAAHVFPFAPWAAKAVEAQLGPRAGPVTCLPCPGRADRLLAPRDTPPVVRTAFHFRDWKNKNAARLIDAVGVASGEIPDLRLEIIGGGDPHAFAALSQRAHRTAPGRVRFLGSVPHDHIQPLLNASTCFALVSHRESYGLVFAEALLAGTPCLIPEGRAIDGYFEDGSVVVSVPPNDVAATAQGLIRLVEEQTAFKSRLEALQTSGGLEALRRPGIARAYASAIANLPTGTQTAQDTPAPAELTRMQTLAPA
ncbi:MAG: glycosyltransferase family 4 protein [Pseudomonadota bacterium]